MTLKPCLVCGDLSEGSRCPEHGRKPDRPGTSALGYGRRWEALSKRARRLQPFCTDCGAVDDLTVDHSPAAWARHEQGLAIRLEDVDVVCRRCNSRRGAARGRAVGAREPLCGTSRISDFVTPTGTPA